MTLAADDRLTLPVEDVHDGRARRRVLRELLAVREREQHQTEIRPVVQRLAVDPARDRRRLGEQVRDEQHGVGHAKSTSPATVLPGDVRW